MLIIYLSAGNELVIGNEFDIVTLGQGHQLSSKEYSCQRNVPCALLGLGVQGVDPDNLDFKGHFNSFLICRLVAFEDTCSVYLFCIS